MPLVWITRTRPAAEETAAKVAALGSAAIVDPVLEARPTTDAIAFDGMGAVAFTSRNGVESFARLSEVRDLPAYAVGDATADAASAVGFATVRSAAGDVQGLARLIGETHDPASGAVLWVAPAEPAEDLGKLLAPYRLNVAALSVYETVSAHPGKALARLADIDAVLVHSPKAARRLVELLDPAARRRLSFLCISERTARPLREAVCEKVLVARFPDEAALLKLLADRPIKRAPGPE